MSPPGDCSTEISNCPLASVLTWANCEGAFALAAHRVTVDFAIGPPPPWTCPSMRTAAAAGLHAQTNKTPVNSVAMNWAFVLVGICNTSVLSHLKLRQTLMLCLIYVRSELLPFVRASHAMSAIGT